VFSVSGEAGYMIGSGMTYPEDCVLHMEARPFLPQDFILDPKGKSQVKNATFFICKYRHILNAVNKD
jgi:hypothetical protein